MKLALLTVGLWLSGSALAYEPLPTTPVTVCERYLLGDKDGGSYSEGWGFSFFQKLIGLRYAPEVTGLQPILDRGASGLIFMPNHTSPVDPVNLVAAIGELTAVRPVMTEDMTQGLMGRLLKRGLAAVNGFILPSPDKGGKTATGLANGVFDEMMNAVHNGSNVLIYPSGTIQMSADERLGNKAAVEKILKADPNARIVLVRQRGWWGSSFSRGSDRDLDPAKKLKTAQLIVRGVANASKILTANALYFATRRPITLEFFEPGADFPRGGTREEINRYIERFYNNPPEKRTYVRKFWWQRWSRKPIEVVEYESDYAGKLAGHGEQVEIDLSGLDAEVYEKLAKSIESVMGSEIQPDTSLIDAGLDSMNKVELILEIERVFGVTLPDDFQPGTVRELTLKIEEEVRRIAEAHANAVVAEAEALTPNMTPSEK